MKRQTPRIRKIFVPVDLSAYSESTVTYASMIAERFKATLILMLVIDSLPYSVTDMFNVIEHRKALQTLASTLQPEHPLASAKNSVKRRLVWGNASRQILAEARREKPDLIILGTHGRTGLPHVVLGSVAEKTVRLAQVPVLTVPLSVSAGVEKRSRPSKT